MLRAYAWNYEMLKKEVPPQHRIRNRRETPHQNPVKSQPLDCLRNPYKHTTEKFSSSIQNRETNRCYTLRLRPSMIP